MDGWVIAAIIVLFTIGRGADAFTRIGPAKDDPEARRRLNWIWAGALVCASRSCSATPASGDPAPPGA